MDLGLNGSEASFFNSDDDDINIGTISRQNNFETKVGNINSETRFVDALPVDGCIVMYADDADS